MTVSPKKIGKWVLGLSAVAAGAAAVSYVVTKKLVDVAVDRENTQSARKDKGDLCRLGKNARDHGGTESGGGCAGSHAA